MGLNALRFVSFLVWRSLPLASSRMTAGTRFSLTTMLLRLSSRLIRNRQR